MRGLAANPRLSDLLLMASALPSGVLRATEQDVVGLLAAGLAPADIAVKLGVSVSTVYSRLRRVEQTAMAHLLSRTRARAPGCRPDPVREALQSDPGHVRMRAALDLDRSFRDLPYAQKQVAGVNGLGWQACRWMARDRARRRDYLTKAGYGTPREPRAVAVDDVCRLLARDLLALYRIRVQVRCESSEPPPPFPGGQGGTAAWLATGEARGPCRVSQLVDAVRERLLSIVPSPELVGQARLPRPRGRGPLLDVYLVPGLWVAARWAAPWPGAGRESWEVRLARVLPAGRFSLGDLLQEERVVVGFASCGREPERSVLLAPPWEEERPFRVRFPALLYWRRLGDPWFVVEEGRAGFLQPGDRVRPLLGEDAWVLVARRVKVRQLPPVAVAHLTAHQVGRECLLATPAEAARLAGRVAVDGAADDCVWRYRPARRVEGRAGVEEEPARLERVWL